MIFYCHQVHLWPVQARQYMKAMDISYQGLGHIPVSYTHLDVYKRQDLCGADKYIFADWGFSFGI